MPVQPGQTLSHYRLVEKIGEGGMGVVWKAEDTVLNRTVAIKVLPVDSSRDEKRREMFLREAQLAAQVGDAHIVQVHEFGREGDLDFIVMEYVEGNPLSKVLHGRPLPPNKVAGLGQQVAHALSKAHRKQLLHRDLKPANILVTPEGEAKVVDFGLATLFAASSYSQATTHTTEQPAPERRLAGTISYMSPEQARMEQLDGRSDVFSLGSILYEMTTGELPFKGPGSVEVLQAVQQAHPTPVHDLVPQVPLELDRIIQKAMAPRRGDRYQSMEDLAVDLSRLGREMESGSSPSYEDLVTADSGQRNTGRLVRLIIGGSVLVLIITLASILAYRQFGSLTDTEALPNRNRIVVLPFENLGPPGDQYFADGMTEEITSRLAVVGGLGVISRSSAMSYEGSTKTIQEIGDELDVQYILEGTVRWDRAGEGRGRVRVTPQLIRVADDTHLWADRYDRRIEDVFAVQSEIAKQVITELAIALPASTREAIEVRPTDNLEAYNAYLRGLDLGYPIYSKDLELALQMFERALDLDPDFALAHAESARILSWYQHIDDPAADPARAEEAIRNALRLAPDSPDAQRNAGWYCYWGQKDYPRAIDHFRRTIELRPNDDYAYLGLGGALRGRGEFDEGLAAKLKAVELAPRSSANYGDVGDSLLFLRRYAEADEYFAKASELLPDLPDFYEKRVVNYWLWDGNTERAEAVLETWPGEPPRTLWARNEAFKKNWQGALEHLSLLGGDDSGKHLNECYYLLKSQQPEAARTACEKTRLLLEKKLEDQPDAASLHSSLGTLYALLGRKADAIREGRRAVQLKPLSEHALLNITYLISLADIYAAVGEQDAAIEQLDHLLSIPSTISVPMLRMDSVWDPLRDNPRFSELLEKYELAL